MTTKAEIQAPSVGVGAAAPGASPIVQSASLTHTHPCSHSSRLGYTRPSQRPRLALSLSSSCLCTLDVAGVLLLAYSRSVGCSTKTWRKSAGAQPRAAKRKRSFSFGFPQPDSIAIHQPRTVEPRVYHCCNSIRSAGVQYRLCIRIQHTLHHQVIVAWAKVRIACYPHIRTTSKSFAPEILH